MQVEDENIQSQEERTYKVKIDKSILRELLTIGIPEIKDKHLKELKKVISVVFIKHFNKYYYEHEELERFAILAVLERVVRYDPSLDAYGYIYTICRNEIGNKVLKLTKETFVDSYEPFNREYSEIVSELPTEIRRFKTYLTGEKPFETLELTPECAINLSLYFNSNQKSRQLKVPSFILESPDIIQCMYKLLLKI